MHELVDLHKLDLLFAALAVAMPAAGALVGAMAGGRRGAAAAGARRGAALGCVGIVNWVLWQVYNAVTNRFGLDTVKNLLINLGLFVSIGAAAGLLWGLRARREGRKES